LKFKTKAAPRFVKRHPLSLEDQQRVLPWMQIQVRQRIMKSSFNYLEATPLVRNITNQTETTTETLKSITPSDVKPK
jgi:hypothetical protein